LQATRTAPNVSIQYYGGYRFDDGSVSISDVTVLLNVIAGKTTL
jgi:hypothetical protein